MGAASDGIDPGSPAGDLPPQLALAAAAGGEMGHRIAVHDWSATLLGPPACWPPQLLSAAVMMLNSRAQIVVFWGPDHVVLYNDAYAPTMGVKHPGFLGRPGRELWSEAWDVLQPLFDGVRATGEAFWATDHLFMIERHGFLEETYFDISYDPVRLDDGTVGGVFCIVSETTARVLGGRRVGTLSALGSRLTDRGGESAVGEQVAAAFGDNPADVPFAALYLDDADDGDALALTGVAGVDAKACWPPGTAGRQALDAVVRSGAPARVPVGDLAAAPPDSVADEALLLPVTAGTRTVGVLAVGVSRFLAFDEQYRNFVDLAAAQISRAVAGARAYEQERRRAAELAALDQAKTNFFSNVSHEFRTPLTLILGPLEDVLAAPDLLDRYRDRLMTMQRNGLRLLKLVNTVLDFSRLESGRLRAAHQATDLADYTARLASTFRSAVDRAGLGLVVDAPPLPAPVYVDREMWEKIVLNLLSNAVKFTFGGGITVRVRADGPVAVLEVRDTGVGIPAAELPLLFERFHRVVGARSRSHEGTGIGLALVRELAELHGGGVDVDSEPGHGSTFTVRIPFGRAHLPAERIVDDGPVVVESVDTRLYVEETQWWVDETAGVPAVPDAVPAGAPEPRTGGRGRILLADDNADLRDHVSRLLRPYWDVTTAPDGQAAVEAATAELFDLVLTDVMMPRLDGFGVIRALRADPRTRDLPIVVLSARAGEEASVEGLAAGADDYLVKPFSARDLLARVRANLELGQLRGRIIRQLRGLVDAATAIGTARSTAEVLRVAAQHVRRMTDAGRVVVTVPGSRFEADGGADQDARPAVELALPDTTGAPLGRLRVWAGDGAELDRELLAQLARLVGLRLENARLYEAEHRIATTLQHSLLPQSLPQVPGAIVASRYLAGNAEAEVGGDWYDVIPAGDDDLVLVIGDVVGKGVHAAAGMGQLRNALRAYILEGFDCGDALTRLNRLVDNLGRRQFATVVCLRFSPGSGRLLYSSAGHPAPVVAEPGGVPEFLYTEALGPPIGALPQARFPTVESRLPPGARILLYTDGLVEDRRNGIDTGLADLLTDVGRPSEHVEDLLDAVLGKAAGRSRRDDIALLALEAAEVRHFALRLPTDPTRLTVLRRRLESFLAAHAVPDGDSFDLTVAVSEAAANAIEHPVDPAEPSITVEVAIADGVVTAVVRDSGRWRPATGTGFRGRGLELIAALAQLEVNRSDEGTELRIRRALSTG